MSNGEKGLGVIIIALAVGMLIVTIGGGEVGEENRGLRARIEDMQATCTANTQNLVAQRDANLAEVGRLQTLLATSQDDRARLLVELAQTQTERDLYRAVYNTIISDFDAAYSGADPFDCWPIAISPIRCPTSEPAPALDRGDEAIIWCLGAGVWLPDLDSCVELYLEGNP